MFGSGGIIQIVLDVVEVVKVGKKQTNILTSTAIYLAIYQFAAQH